MCCVNAIVTGSLDTGATHVFTTAGSSCPPASSGEGRANAPFTRWPGETVLGSDTVSAASPAVEITVAVVLAS
jgi:hypothetical protein